MFGSQSTPAGLAERPKPDDHALDGITLLKTIPGILLVGCALMSLLAIVLATAPINETGTAQERNTVSNMTATSIAPPTTAVALNNCVTSECHSGHKEHKFTHGPLFVNACDNCHTLTNPQTHSYDFSRPMEQLCVYCHELDTHEEKLIHQPFEDGSCISCHSPHGGDEPGLLRSTHYSDLCLGCHQDLAQARDLVHGPASEGACNACHQPHASENRKLLETDGREMCLSCHPTIQTEIDNARLVHEPIRKDCQLCHDPHATETPALLVDKPSELCIQCHEKIAHQLDNSKTQHGAITTERGCISCHSAHTSDNPRLLKNDVKSLCFECHNKEIEREDGSVIPNMEALIETGTSLHGPIASGNCVLCHDIHGSEHNQLLVRNYSKALYTPFQESEYALCFGCHDKALVLDEQSTTVTAFRNGETNLHFVHVNRDKKGRTCAICHNSHASKSDQHLNEKVPFGSGGWELPIQFQRIGDGGTCASGCHNSLVYDRTNPVVYPDPSRVDD
jgi:predicted CXXCH cytochrome family protein